MTKLKYTFKNDTLFKMVFVKYPDLLRRLVAELLGIRLESIRDLAKIEALEVTVMKEAIGAYRQIAATGELREIERLRSLARHNEASALRHAQDKGRDEGEQKGKIESVMLVLESRFGDIPVTLRKKLLKVQENERIEATLKLAATCQNLKEFQKELS